MEGELFTSLLKMHYSIDNSYAPTSPIEKGYAFVIPPANKVWDGYKGVTVIWTSAQNVNVSEANFIHIHVSDSIEMKLHSYNLYIA